LTFRSQKIDDPIIIVVDKSQETRKPPVKFLARYPAGRLRTRETGENKISNILARYTSGRLRAQETGENKHSAFPI
jgi:hypothetical protein